MSVAINLWTWSSSSYGYGSINVNCSSFFFKFSIHFFSFFFLYERVQINRQQTLVVKHAELSTELRENFCIDVYVLQTEPQINAFHVVTLHLTVASWSVWCMFTCSKLSSLINFFCSALRRSRHLILHFTDFLPVAHSAKFRTKYLSSKFHYLLFSFRSWQEGARKNNNNIYSNNDIMHIKKFGLFGLHTS